MRKLFLNVSFLALIFSFILAPIASVFAAANPMQSIAGQNVKDMPTQLIFMIDYDGRTDGQPVYLGWARWQTATGSSEWIVYNFLYDEDDQVISRKLAFGAWDDRISLTYQ